MTLAILMPDDPRWLAAWEGWPRREPYAHPAFARLFAPAGEEPFALLGASAAGAVLFPLLRRRVGGGRDLGNPYGYGGPMRIGDPDAAAFWREAFAWARGEGFATLSSRLSLEDDVLALPERGVVAVQPNVVRELDLTPDALFMDYDHKVRKNVKKALRHGLTVEVDAAGRELAAFHAVYLDTMERNGAAPYFRFPREVFADLLRAMPQALLFFHARQAGRIVSTELVLRSRTTLFSFLGGTLAEAFDDRPNDLLKHEIALWGIANGCERYVLGGGVGGRDGGEDGIFRYKLAFAPRGRRDFRVLRLDLDPPETRRLVAARAAAEPGWGPVPGAFPPYR